jgi:hypothetical protein
MRNYSRAGHLTQGYMKCMQHIGWRTYKKKRTLKSLMNAEENNIKQM